MSIGGMSKGKSEGEHDSGDQGPQSLSLMGGVVRPEGMPEASDVEFSDAPKISIKISQNTRLILGLFAIAIGAIYLMRWSQHDVMSSVPPEVETRIEEALAKLQSKAMDPSDPLAQKNVDGLFSDVDSVVHIFDDDPTTRQVPLEYVQKNPFISPVVKASDMGNGGAAIDLRVKKLEAELKTLTLKSIAQGRVPLALINDQMVQPGQKIGSFLVLSITGLTVELTAEGNTYHLTMDDKIKDKAR